MKFSYYAINHFLRNFAPESISFSRGRLGGKGETLTIKLTQYKWGRGNTGKEKISIKALRIS